MFFLNKTSFETIPCCHEVEGQDQSYMRSPRSVAANMLNCNTVVSKFKLQSHNYIHFWTNALGKYELPYPSSHGLNSITTVLLQG